LKVRRHVRRLAPLAVCGAAAVFLLRQDGLSAERVLQSAPEHPLGAALFLLLLYAAKGLSFFFPMAVLEAAGGLLFPPAAAIALNLMGMSAATSLPYLLGRRERGGLDALTVRFPKLGVLRSVRSGNDFLFVFLVRLTGLVPCDLVSLWMGAANVPYRAYLTAGLLGLAPHMITATVLGSALSHPGDRKALWIALAAAAAVTVLSLSLWQVRRRRRAGVSPEQKKP